MGYKEERKDLVSLHCAAGWVARPAIWYLDQSVGLVLLVSSVRRGIIVFGTMIIVNVSRVRKDDQDVYTLTPASSCMWVVEGKNKISPSANAFSKLAGMPVKISSGDDMTVRS